MVFSSIPGASQTTGRGNVTFWGLWGQAGVRRLPKVLAVLASGAGWPWTAESCNLMRSMFVTLFKKSNLFSNYSLSCITVHRQSVAI